MVIGYRWLLGYVTLFECRIILSRENNGAALLMVLSVPAQFVEIYLAGERHFLQIETQASL